MAKFSAKLHGKPVTLCSTDLGPILAYDRQNVRYDAFGMMWFVDGDCLGCNVVNSVLTMASRQPDAFRMAEDLAWLEGAGVTEIDWTPLE